MQRIPTITKNLLIINVLMFIATWVFDQRGVDLNRMLGLHFFLASDFSVTQLFTYMFMHAGITHLFFNMFALWMFGCVVENMWGPKRFLFYYLACGVGAGLIQEVAQFGEFYMLASTQFPNVDVFEVAANSTHVLNMWNTIGASGATYAVLLAFGMIFPEERIFIFPIPVPIKAKWFVCIYIAIELFSALGTSGSNVAHFAHLGGMLFGWLLIRHWRRNRGGGNFGGFNVKDSFFDSMKRNWEKRTHRKADDFGCHDTARRESDWDYNQRKKQEEDEIDRILDKVKRSGYDSLSESEKRKLFDGGKR